MHTAQQKKGPTALHHHVADQAADEAADIRSGSDESTAAGDDPAGPSFHLVQLSLAPPQPHRGAAAATAAAAAGRGGGGQLSAAAGKALRRLLELCGINGVVADATEQEDTSSKLTTFIPEAAEVRRGDVSEGLWRLNAVHWGDC